MTNVPPTYHLVDFILNSARYSPGQEAQIPPGCITFLWNHGYRYFPMELMRGNALFRHLLDQYSKKPTGWNFTIGPSPKDNFFDGLVSGPEESWQLKLDSIFKPAPIVLGAKVDSGISLQPGNFPSYGYRKLQPEIMLKLFKEIYEEPNPAAQSSLDHILGSLSPVAPVQGESYAEGPVVFTNKKILGVSKNQKELDDKLSSEIRKLLRESYPSYG
jgi:hypothetical protein